MKNIHVLPTDKPSRLFTSFGKLNIGDYITERENTHVQNQNIYITSDEEIKVGDWTLMFDYLGNLFLCDKPQQYLGIEKGHHLNKGLRKIILTTDQDLIKDGVQAIDDEFLEWFVKNPSCESVGVRFFCCGQYDGKCEPKCFRKSNEIIIPKEEAKQDLEKEMFELEQELDIPSNLRWHNSKPKQETLKEYDAESYLAGIKSDLAQDYWCKQQERMYSEEEVYKLTLEALDLGMRIRQDQLNGYSEKSGKELHKEWFKQFKNK